MATNPNKVIRPLPSRTPGRNNIKGTYLIVDHKEPKPMTVANHPSFETRYGMD